MKKVNQLETIKPKTLYNSATQSTRKIEQKCIETNMVFAEDIDDDSVFSEVVKNDKITSLLLPTENNYSHLGGVMESGNSSSGKPSEIVNQNGLWGKENFSSKLEDIPCFHPTVIQESQN
jgi:hypothetical protein